MKSKPLRHNRALAGALSCALWVLGCGGSGAASNQVSRVDVALEPPPGAATVASALPVHPLPMQTMPAVEAAASSSAPTLDADAAAREELERLLEEAATANAQGTGSLILGGANAGVGVLSLGGGTSGGASVGRSPAVKGPASNVTVTGTAQGNVAGLDALLAAMRPGFRRCHQRWLAQDPGAAGSITLRADLDASGGVSAVTVTRTDARLGETVVCAKSRLSVTQFPAPFAGKASVTVDIDFALRP